jgi:hypothetical protein
MKAFAVFVVLMCTVAPSVWGQEQLADAAFRELIEREGPSTIFEFPGSKILLTQMPSGITVFNACWSRQLGFVDVLPNETCPPKTGIVGLFRASDSLMAGPKVNYGVQMIYANPADRKPIKAIIYVYAFRH